MWWSRRAAMSPSAIFQSRSGRARHRRDPSRARDDRDQLLVLRALALATVEIALHPGLIRLQLVQPRLRRLGAHEVAQASGTMAAVLAQALADAGEQG